MPKKFKTMQVFRTMDMPEVIKELVRKKIRLGFAEYKEFQLNPEWQFIAIAEDKKERLMYLSYIVPLTGAEVLHQRVESGITKVIERGSCPVSDWLFDNGAKLFSRVLIWDM